MNFLDIKAGDIIEIGTQKAYRFWRYAMPDDGRPVRLFSWVSDMRWHSGCDGVVFGTVEMWGIVWDHERGYRAQFARPTSFVSSCGYRSGQALAELRANFL